MSHAVVCTHSKRELCAGFFRLFMKKDSSVSPELLEFMKLHSIPNLIALLKFEDENLLKMNGFGWRLMREVLVLRECQ